MFLCYAGTMADHIRCDYLIIGGGIAGTTAAETIRETDRYGVIAIVEGEPHQLYSRVLLPYYIKGKIDIEKVFLRQIADYENKHLDLYVNEMIEDIDFEKREARALSGRVFAFQKLLLASGGRPQPWPHALRVPAKTLYLQTLADAERFIAITDEAENKSAIVVGGGFIALELLEAFRARGFAVTLMMRHEYFWPRFFEEEGAGILEQSFRANDIALMKNAEIADVVATSDGVVITTKDTRQTQAALVGVGIGLRRVLSFLGNVLKIGEGVIVDEELRASRPDVWAAGDVAQYTDPYSGRARVVGNWTEAFTQGRIAGRNMTGAHEKIKMISSYSIKNFGNVITIVGDAEATPAGVAPRLAIHRADLSRRRYERFILHEHRLVGAVLVNAFDDKTSVTKLIEQKTDLSEYHADLASLNFDLSTI